MSIQLTLTDDEVALVLMALGEYKAKQYLIENYSLSHRATDVINKVKGN